MYLSPFSLLGCALAAVWGGARPATACGPFFPNQLVTEGDNAVLKAPAGDLRRELARIELATSLVAVPSDDPAEQTAEGAVADLDRALSELGTPALEKASLLGWYADIRTRLREVAAARAHGTSDTAPPLPALAAARLRQLPAEFRAYLEGALAYHAGHLSEARRRWRSVVEAAPAAKRTYRATWAAFMLGRSLVDERPAEAIGWFRRTRALARNPKRHADRLGLAAASLGWEARAELHQGRYRRAIALYLEQLKSGQHFAVSSLVQVFRRVRASAPEALPQLARDRVARQVMTAVLLWSGAPADAWLQAVEAARGSDLPDADRLAWAAYQRGQMETAARWLRRARKTSPIASWIQAKLLLREGRVTEAATHLAAASRGFPPNEVWISKDETFGYLGFGRGAPSAQAAAELGVLRLARRQFTEALDALWRAGFWLDAAYVAEQVLTVAELQAYVDRACPTVPAERPDGPRDAGARLRHLLARRLARIHREPEARRYLPPSLRADLDAYARALRVGNDPWKPQGERADALWAAARIARRKGMELLGTELSPDWFCFDGAYALRDVAAIRPRSSDAALTGSAQEERRRTTAHPTEPDKRFHYRYLAADLAWRAAKLLPDNTDAKARILYEAGSWLKARDPQAADRFYKALVLRCRATDLGREAADCRWFPPRR